MSIENPEADGQIFSVAPAPAEGGQSLNPLLILILEYLKDC